MKAVGNSRARSLRALGALAAVALAASACSTSTTGGSSAAEGDYVIGYTSGISGVGAAIAKGEITGLKAAFAQVNKAGGVNGHQLKLVTMDSADDPARGASNVTKMVKSDGALAVFGLVGSPACTPNVRLSETYQVPVVCGVADTSDLKPTQPYLYTKYGSEVTEARAMVDVVKAKITKPEPKLGFVFIDFPSAREWATAVKKEAAAAGYDTVAFDGIAATSVDLSTEAARLRKAGADVVLTQIISPQVISLNHAIKAQGSDISMITEATTADYPTLKGLADPSVYQLMLAPLVDPTSTEPAVTDYLAAIKAAGLTTDMAGANSAYVALSYAQAMHTVEALKKCGKDCTGETLNKALNEVELSLPGINENYSYTTDRHYPQTYFTVAQYDATRGDVVNDPTKYEANPIP